MNSNTLSNFSPEQLQNHLNRMGYKPKPVETYVTFSFVCPSCETKNARTFCSMLDSTQIKFETCIQCNTTGYLEIVTKEIIN